MSQENVEAFKRAVVAYSCRDVDVLLRELDPEVEWHPGLPAVLGGEATVYRGHSGVRDVLRDVYDAFAEIRMGSRTSGTLASDSSRSAASTRVEVEVLSRPTPQWAYLVHFKNRRANLVRTYLDPAEALEAAGPREERGARRALRV